jgi:hypothetical protein
MDRSYIEDACVNCTHAVSVDRSFSSQKNLFEVKKGYVKGYSMCQGLFVGERW